LRVAFRGEVSREVRAGERLGIGVAQELKSHGEGKITCSCRHPPPAPGR
jgi:hypothetical protein